MSDKLNDYSIPSSAMDLDGRATKTLADYYDAQNRAASAFEIPVDEYRDMLADLTINQIGIPVLVDGQREHIMLADLEKVITNIQGNMKSADFLHASKVKRGSRIDFDNGAVGLCWSIPDDDIVSLSSILIILNNRIEFFRIASGYDENPNSPTYGDSITNTLYTIQTVDAFVERIDGQIRAQDNGIFHDSVLRVFTFEKDVMSEPKLKLGDIAKINSKYYEVNDIDDFTSGVTRLQLAKTRTDYDGWTVEPFELED